ncbi:MAG: hypothetical protein ACO1OQ_06445 [Rufibacter sp.]
MKNAIIAFALLFTVAGSSLANGTSTTTSVVSTAREIANALEVNEGVYLKIKGFEKTRQAEMTIAKAALTGEALTLRVSEINAAFSNAVLQVLTPAQQKMFVALAGGQIAQTLAHN